MRRIAPFLIMAACGKENAAAPDPKPTSVPRVQPVVPPAPAVEPSKHGLCEVTLTGGLSLTARMPNLDRTVASRLWLDDAGKAVVSKTEGQLDKAGMEKSSGPVLWIDCADPTLGVFLHLHNSEKAKPAMKPGKYRITFPADAKQQAEDFTAEISIKKDIVAKPSGTFEVTRFERGEVEATFSFSGTNMTDAQVNVTGKVTYHCADKKHCGL